MATTKYWKVWLTPNLLTKDVDNDYIAEVSTSKHTLRNEDIAQRIVAEGSEIKYDTLLSIINQHDRIIREAVCDGYSVLTGVGQYSPRVPADLEAGEYTLRIVTQFTNSGSTLLKEPRTIEYDMPLTVS